MAYTPAQPRMNNSPWGQRLTPLNQSLMKSTNKIAPKSNRNDIGLSLRHVIGTTANSPNAIDTLLSNHSLAFTAGAAAVICSFDEDLNFTQRFYRARPTAIPLNPVPTIYGPSTPTGTSAEFRSRASYRESGAGLSPFGTPTADWSDSPGKTWTARERVKAATSVSFSPDGKFLAIGETGYKPRVLIFSTSKESSPDTPLTCLPDHTFGVRCVAFSPNSQYLASLGAANDGFLYIWNINNRNGSASLYASNKCTSNISQIAWMGSSLVTVGTRHVKLWRIEGSTVSTPVKSIHAFMAQSNSNSNSAPKILSGRNCLLGSMLEATFTVVVTLSNSQAIVCSDAGDVCLLDDTDVTQKFFRITNVGAPISAAALDLDKNLVITVTGGMIKLIDRKSLQEEPKPDESRRSTLPDAESQLANTFVALAPFGKYMAAVDDHRSIKLIQWPSTHKLETPLVKLQLPAHGGPVLGVRPLRPTGKSDASFFTWSSDGTILFWSQSGACKRQIKVELEQTEDTDDNTMNELKVVRNCPSANAMISGDRLGVLRVIDATTGKCVYSLRAHAGEITDIQVLEEHGPLLASSGRDRAVQIFKKRDRYWELIQTLDEHVGAVTGLQFTSDGSQLISCSSDRTVVVRESLTRKEQDETLTAFAILRTITLKATPVSMCLVADRDDTLLISTVDRNVQKYSLLNGHQISSFKASDSEGGDAVVLSSLIHLISDGGQNILAGLSSTDKSLRLYDDNGTIQGRDWGHTEGVTDLTIITTKVDTEVEAEADSSSRKCLVSVAVDGTVFIWSLGGQLSNKNDLSSSMDIMGLTPTLKDLVSNKPPLRRVLSQSEMARFRQPFPEQEDVTTPTNNIKRATKPLEKKSSRFSLAQAPKLEPSPITTFDPSSGPRRRARNRSPSPPSPKRLAQRSSLHRRSSFEPRSLRASKSMSNTAPTSSELAGSTDSICRTLRSYRKKLTASPDILQPDMLRDLERELGLTARALGEKAMKAKGAVEESMMVKLLSQYSERLIEMLDERFKVVSIGKGETSDSSNGCTEDEAGSGLPKGDEVAKIQNLNELANGTQVECNGVA